MSKDIQKWANEVLEKINQKMDVMIQRNRGKIPYSSNNSTYDNFAESDISWWTNGFFAGSLWQLYHENGQLKYRENAEIIEKMLDRALFEFLGLHHDVGFMWLHTAIANYRLTGNKESRVRGLHAANLLLSRYNAAGEYLVAWNCAVPGWSIIDSMMNIPILYWASEELKDPRFHHVATKHANTLEKNLIRNDGSAGHIASFDPVSGQFVEMIRGQGYSASSAWSRGQAWGIYGFALSYRYTQEQHYLDTAKKIANYFIGNIAQNGYVPLVDFRGPVGTTKIDTSAGACAACGMLEIANHIEGAESAYYRNAAVLILKALVKEYADWDVDTDGILYGSSHSYHQKKETEIHLVYGDYFLIEGILRLLYKEFHIW